MKFHLPHEVSPELLGVRMCKHIGTNGKRVNNNRELFGFEVEIEGNGSHHRAFQLDNAYWRCDNDPSLRGESIETVFVQPFPIKAARGALENFREKFYDFDQKSMSERTSVHVHYNISCHTTKEFHRLMTVLYLFENAITLRAGGKERTGNKFCLRLKDSETPLTTLIECFRTQDFYRGLQSKQIGRYSNINLLSIRKFGSIELRCHRGTTDVDALREFLDVFAEIVTNSVDNFKDAPDVLYQLSARGYEDFMSTYFPKTLSYFAKLDDPEGLVEECLDYAQSLAFCFTEGENGLKKRQRFRSIRQRAV